MIWNVMESKIYIPTAGLYPANYPTIKMDSPSATISGLSYWEYSTLLILRPALATTFVLLFISLGWFLAWKLVLVHVPLIQEVFGLRKKKAPKGIPPSRRFSRYYNSQHQ